MLRDLIVIAFWIWTGVSAVVLVRRLLTRSSRSSTAGDAPDTDDLAGLDAEARVLARLQHQTDALATDPGEPIDRARADATGTRPAGRAPADAAETEPTDADGAESSPGATAGDESEVAPVTPVAEATPSEPLVSPVLGTPVVRSVADVLEGITMPCDLVPYVQGSSLGALTSALRVSFTTQSAPAPTVAAQLRSELERLGLEITAGTDLAFVATREQDRVEVTVHPSAAAAVIDDRPAFPTAPTDAVAVEIRTR